MATRSTRSKTRFTRIPLAGGGQETLLSEVGRAYLLPYFDTDEACVLRLVCREFLAAVTEQPWADAESVIKGSIAAWRASFPRALRANVGRRGSGRDRRKAPVVDADFVHFEGLHELNMAECTSATDAAFAHLRGIHTLNMNRCSQPGITDAAFAHLRGIHTLDMRGCRQPGLTDAAFAHLRGIHTLHMGWCRQPGITDAAFAHLRGIHTLDMSGCSQPGVTDAAFAHLRGIHTLDMGWCQQAGITDAAFAHLRGIHRLNMSDCSQAGITDAALVHLRGIRTLHLARCSQHITGGTFAHLQGAEVRLSADRPDLIAAAQGLGLKYEATHSW